MNPIPDAVWSRGLSWSDYREQASRNAGVLDEVYREPSYGPADLDFLRRLPPLRLVAIGEDWCPDVYQTLPTWARLAEELSGWSLRVFPRDAHPELMDSFLWKNEARRIPVYAFYDARGYLQTWWSGRSAAAQREVDALLEGRGFGDLSPEEKKRVGERLDDGYHREFRRANLEELMALLGAFFHQPREGRD